MTLADMYLDGREFETVVAQINIYCYRCNGMVRSGESAKRYDAATYTHVGCPKTPLKTYAPHKYGG